MGPKIWGHHCSQFSVEGQLFASRFPPVCFGMNVKTSHSIPVRPMLGWKHGGPIVAIAEDELRSGCSARYYKFLCAAWQIPTTHVPLTIEMSKYIKETSSKRSMLSEHAKSYSTGQMKNLYAASKSDSSAAWSSLRNTHHMSDVLEG